MSRPVMGTVSLLFSWYHDSLWAVKWPGCEVDQSAVSSAEVRMTGAVRLHPLYPFMVWAGKTAPLRCSLFCGVSWPVLHNLRV